MSVCPEGTTGMNITEVRVKLLNDPDDRLLAICSMTIDNAFVVRDLKIIERETGLFVAMPSRKLSSYCPHCGQKNQLRVAFCNQCGRRLPEAASDPDSKEKLYADIAHPINSASRKAIEECVIAAYEAEKKKQRRRSDSKRSEPSAENAHDLRGHDQTPQPETSRRTTPRIDTEKDHNQNRRPLVIDVSDSTKSHGSPSAPPSR